jgi:hypothetical protein
LGAQARQSRFRFLTRRIHANELDILDAIRLRMYVLQHENARHR